MNVTYTLVSSTTMKTLAMDDFTSVQTLALVAYAFGQTNVHLLRTQYLSTCSSTSRLRSPSPSPTSTPVEPSPGSPPLPQLK